MDYHLLAERLFPHIHTTPEEIEASRKLAESVGVELRVRKYV